MHLESMRISTITREVRKETWEDYQEACGKRLDMLQGFWMTELLTWSFARLNKIGWNQIYRDKWPWTTETNLLYRVINRIAKVYVGSVRRRMMLEAADGSITLDDAYGDMISNPSINLDVLMDEALRVSLACGGCLIRPMIREKGGDEWVFHLITPDLFVADQDPVDPQRMVGVTYKVPLPDSPQGDTLFDEYTFCICNEQTPYYEIRDEDGHLKQRWGVNSTIQNGEPTDGAYPWIVNGKAILPFAIVRMNNSQQELFNRAEGLDLYEVTLKAGLTETIKSWHLIQGGKHIMLGGAGVSDIATRPMDVSIPITMKGGGSQEMTATILDMIDDCARYDDCIEKWEERAIESRTGTRVDSLASTGVESAKSLQIKDKGLALVIEREQMYMRTAERELASIMSIEHNLFGSGSKINTEARFAIDFPDYLEADPMETLAETKDLISMGVSNRAELLMQVDPDIHDEDEAIEIILHNQDVERRISGLITTDQAAAAETVEPPAQQGESLPTEPIPEIAEEINEREQTEPQSPA